jgi:DNA (cytosine-5)-methyltransferase 1
MTLRVLDLFSGIGGFSLGLERAGMQTVAFCEIDKKARMVLKKHWPSVPIFEDVSELTAEKLNEQAISVDVICGGFPCQDISLAGRGAGLEGERSGLWFQFYRLIKEIKPSWVIIENVSALRSRGLDEVLRCLSEVRYDAEWHCIPASAIGAPHRRDRIWIVAHPRYRGGRNIGPFEERSEHQSKWATNSNSVGGSSEQSPSLADSGSEGLQGDEWSGQAGTQRISEGHLTQCSWWAVEPDVGRVAHGVSGRVDRLKQLGNAVVPQIPEMLGKIILEKMQKNDVDAVDMIE